MVLQQNLLHLKKECSDYITNSSIKLYLVGEEECLELDIEKLLREEKLEEARHKKEQERCEQERHKQESSFEEESSFGRETRIFNLKRILPKTDGFFLNLIQPHIGEITKMYITNLSKFEDLTTIFPHFFNEMDKLNTLDISLSKYGTWSPPSENPFGEFPDALKSLFLGNIPLHSFSNLKILTKFSFSNTEYSVPLDALFTFLRENPLLEHVKLIIVLKGHIPRCLQDQAPINLKQLQYLLVRCKYREDIKYLVSYIPPPKGANVVICPEELGGLGTILPHLKCVVTLPTYMKMNYESHSIKLLGPNGCLSSDCLPNPEISLILKRNAQINFENIETIHLIMSDSGEIPFEKLMFPALKIIIIEQDRKITHTISTLFSLPGPPPHRLELRRCTLSEREDARKLLGSIKGNSSSRVPLSQWLQLDVFGPIIPSNKDNYSITISWIASDHPN